MEQEEESWALKLLILEDERRLEDLRKLESEIALTQRSSGYGMATKRKALLSEMTGLEDRLRKNRKHLSDLKG